MKKVAVSILLSLMVFSGNLVFSQDFEVAPVDIDFSVEPGESDFRIVYVTNHSNKKASFLLSMADFIMDERGEAQEAPAGTTDRSCANWLTISPSFFDLNPNERQEVMVSILVPKDDYSTRWARVFVRTTEEQTAFSADKNLVAGIIISPRITIRITQSPQSNKNYAGRIGGMKEFKKEDANPGDRFFKTTVRNTGDKIARSRAFLIATNMETEEETTYPDFRFQLYPGSSREVELHLPAGLTPGKYALSAILDLGHGTLQGTQMIIDVP